MAGFRMGEVSKNEMAPEKGAPLLNRPTSTGMVEHEQNGVMAPSRAPRTAFSILCGRVRRRLIRSFDTQTCKRATRKLMAMKSANSSAKR